MTGKGSKLTVLACAALILTLACCQGRDPAPRVRLKPFGYAFRVISKLRVPGVRPSDVRGFAACGRNSIYFINQATVTEIDGRGSVLMHVGTSGWQPGGLVRPSALACGSGGALYILDLAAGRVSVFSPQGVFERSVSLAPLGIAGVGIAAPSCGPLLVGGFHNPPDAGSPMLYQFGPDGMLLQRFYPQYLEVAALHLTAVGGVSFGLDAGCFIFAAQPASEIVSVFSGEGQPLRSFDTAPPFYRHPVSLPSPMPAGHAAVMRLLSRWTELEGIQVLPPRGPVLITFWLHAPQHYSIGIFSEHGKSLADWVGTDYFPAAVNEEGVVYFFDPSAPDLVITEARMDLRQGSSQ